MRSEVMKINKKSSQEYGATKQWKDVIQKYISALYKDSILEFYGVKAAKVKELISANLPVVDVRNAETDQVLLMDDNTYVHLGFETGLYKKVLVRHLEYDVRLYDRDEREIKTVIVYTSDVKEVPPPLKIGPDITYSPDAVLLVKYDGDAIISEIERKIAAKERLTDQDIIKLTFLPFMKIKMPRNEMAHKAISLAKSIEDNEKRDACIATTIAYASKMLAQADIKKLLEAIRLTDLGVVMEEVFGADAAKIEIAKEMLADGEPVVRIVKYTKLDEDTVLRLQKELAVQPV